MNSETEKELDKATKLAEAAYRMMMDAQMFGCFPGFVYPTSLKDKDNGSPTKI